MASESDFRRLALALDGAQAKPHFDRTAFRVVRNFATLAADGRSANLKLTPDEQEHLCMLYLAAFAPAPKGWGRQGWTMARLDKLSEAELAHALEIAWRHASPRKPSRKSSG